MSSQDTIVAISTAAGTSAIAIVRLSGPLTFQIGKKIFIGGRFPNNGSSLTHSSKEQSEIIWTSRKAIHGFICDPVNYLPIDEVVLIPYGKQNSYTGEDLLEINCHGSQLIVSEILSLCLSQGARLAKPGEFTQRAFLSGRLDLTQAEGVLDLIQAKTMKQSRLALSALTGHLGERIVSIRSQLIELLTRIVAGIDFPDEVGDIPVNDVNEIVEDSLTRLKALAETAKSGKFLREGIKIAIVGKPNAGKSSLLNQLLKFERAIVTEIPGTTRDSLEELIEIRGVPVTLIDTAGIRHTEDKVERMGIERTRKTIEAAHLVLFVADPTTSWQEADELILEALGEKPYLTLVNKSDITGEDNLTGMPPQNRSCLTMLSISAKNGTGIEKLNDEIERFCTADGQLTEIGASLNARQSELANKAIEALRLVKEAVDSSLPLDCLATDLKATIDNLSEICGESVSDEVIGQVFANFCIGK